MNARPLTLIGILLGAVTAYMTMNQPDPEGALSPPEVVPTRGITFIPLHPSPPEESIVEINQRQRAQFMAEYRAELAQEGVSQAEIETTLATAQRHLALIDRMGPDRYIKARRDAEGNGTR